MNASDRLNNLLKNPRNQKRSKWIDAFARITDFTRVRFFTSLPFSLGLVALPLIVVGVGTHFNIMSSIANFLYPILGLALFICGFQVWHIERVCSMGDAKRNDLAKKIEELKTTGTTEDTVLVGRIATLLHRDVYQNYHAHWWGSVGHALNARLDELNTVDVQVDADTRLDNLSVSPKPKHLKV